MMERSTTRLFFSWRERKLLILLVVLLSVSFLFLVFKANELKHDNKTGTASDPHQIMIGEQDINLSYPPTTTINASSIGGLNSGDQGGNSRHNNNMVSSSMYVMPDRSMMTKISKHVFILPVYDAASYIDLMNNVPCIQRKMSQLNDNEKTVLIIYGLNSKKNLIEDLQTIKYFDFIRLEVKESVHSLVETQEGRRALQTQIISDVKSRFERSSIKIEIQNEQYVFSNTALMSLLSLTTNQCTESRGSETWRKDFAMVIPFPKSQIPALLEQLERWRLYKPCVGEPKIYKKKTDLIFYFHRNKDLSMQKQIMSALTTTGTINGPLRPELECFSSEIQFWYSHLLQDEDSYPMSANHMFYRLLFSNKLYTQYQSFFYAEPDTFPIQNGWLTRVLNQAYMTDSSWWVSGSIFRGKLSYVNDGKAEDDPSGGSLDTLSNNIHINGNALYNTVNTFRDFVTRIRESIPNYPYDAAPQEYLFKFGWRYTREVWHHFHFSDFIQNIWKTDWNEEDVARRYPDTYLVHGKQHETSKPKPAT